MAGSNDPAMSRWLSAVARRIRVRRAGRWVCFSLLAWGVAGLVVLGVGRLLPLGWERPAVLVSAAAAVVIGGAIGLLLPLPGRLVARSADRDLDSRDRIITAVELQERPTTDDVGELQVASTEGYLSRIATKEAAPMRLPVASSRAVLVIVALVGLLLGIPNPMDAVAQRRAEAAAELERRADEVREQAERLEDSALSEEEKALAVEELEDLARRLEEADDLRAGLEEIARSESRLQSLQRSDQLAAKTLLANIDRSLEEDPLADGAEGSLADQLDDLAELLPRLATDERAEAADRLDQMAANLETTDTDLAEDLRDAAAALREGDDPGALDTAAESAREAQKRISGQESLSSARTALQEARASLQEASERIASGAAQGSGDGSDQRPGGSQQGEEAGEGEGSSGEGGSGSTPGTGQRSGSSAGNGEGDGASGQSGEGAGSGGREGGTGASDVDTRVFDPILGGEIAEELRVKGELGEGPQTTMGREPGLTSPGRILIPYSSVYPAWSARAARTVEVLPIPASLRSFVRDYFTALEPTGVR